MGAVPNSGYAAVQLPAAGFSDCMTIGVSRIVAAIYFISRVARPTSRRRRGTTLCSVCRRTRSRLQGHRDARVVSHPGDRIDVFLAGEPVDVRALVSVRNRNRASADRTVDTRDPGELTVRA